MRHRFLFKGAGFMDFRPQEIIMFLLGQCAARVLRQMAELIVRYSGAAPWVGGGPEGIFICACAGLAPWLWAGGFPCVFCDALAKNTQVHIFFVDLGAVRADVSHNVN